MQSIGLPRGRNELYLEDGGPLLHLEEFHIGTEKDRLFGCVRNGIRGGSARIATPSSDAPALAGYEGNTGFRPDKAEHPSNYAGVLNQMEVAMPYVFRAKATGSIEVSGPLILALLTVLVVVAVVAYKLLLR